MWDLFFGEFKRAVVSILGTYSLNFLSLLVGLIADRPTLAIAGAVNLVLATFLVAMLIRWIAQLVIELIRLVVRAVVGLGRWLVARVKGPSDPAEPKTADDPSSDALEKDLATGRAFDAVCAVWAAIHLYQIAILTHQLGLFG